ncbi:hypothetical protein PVAP13_3KG219827 [Panicum virgatum]|uniref:RING-type E3 ubiquitin transferase n=1 Tax=Panicum virgatum TaxID=38727 RepID=A0A8T0URM9_PANVG|nr:hypothetical protein PVAP13_3KG219827 [Panicum virgatum]
MWTLRIKRTERVLPTGTSLTIVSEEQAIKDDVGTVRIQQLDKGPFYGSPTYLESWEMVQVGKIFRTVFVLVMVS